MPNDRERGVLLAHSDVEVTEMPRIISLLAMLAIMGSCATAAPPRYAKPPRSAVCRW